MRRCILFFLFWWCSLHGLAQSGAVYSNGAVDIAYGGIGSILSNQESIFKNPAGTTSSTINNFGAIVNYQNNYGLANINQVGIGLIKHLPKSAFSLGLHHFGISEYQEQGVLLGYARKLFDKLNVGIQFNYNRLAIQEVLNANQVSVNLGFQSQISKQILFGGYISNAIKAASDDYKSPALIAFGILYKPSVKVGLACEFYKLADRAMSVKFGIQYQPIQRLKLRLGFDTTEAEYGFGLDLDLKYFRLLMGVANHWQLGPSLGGTAIY